MINLTTYSFEDVSLQTHFLRRNSAIGIISARNQQLDFLLHAVADKYVVVWNWCCRQNQKILLLGLHFFIYLEPIAADYIVIGKFLKWFVRKYKTIGTAEIRTYEEYLFLFTPESMPLYIWLSPRARLSLLTSFRMTSKDLSMLTWVMPAPMRPAPNTATVLKQSTRN